MTGLSPACAARVQKLEAAQDALAAKDKELEDTAAALRTQLSENAAQNQRIADLQAIIERACTDERPSSGLCST